MSERSQIWIGQQIGEQRLGSRVRRATKEGNQKAALLAESWVANQAVQYWVVRFSCKSGEGDCQSTTEILVRVEDKSVYQQSEVGTRRWSTERSANTFADSAPVGHAKVIDENRDGCWMIVTVVCEVPNGIDGVTDRSQFL